MNTKNSQSSASHKWARQLDTIFARCEGAYSDLTLTGYRNDLNVFAKWCLDRQLELLPASPQTIADFLDHQCCTCSYATIRRRASAIRFAHSISNLPCPLANSAVFLALRRAARLKGRRPKQVLGLTRDMLDKILESCPESFAGTRDAALLSLGYDTLCRSSELSWMRVEHVELKQGFVYIPRAKNDPFGDGRMAKISQETCDLVSEWLNLSKIIGGPLFRGLHTGSVGSSHMDTSSIRRIVKAAAKRAGFTQEAEKLSGHSMRVGAAQDLLIRGYGIAAIMTAGGWKSHEIVARYVEHSFNRSERSIR